MKFTYNWIREFLDLRIPAEELADKLTMVGLEVKSTVKHGSDYVFEVEITSNRPDWLSVIGIAREIAAITGKRLRSSPVSQSASSRTAKPIRSKTGQPKIHIENKKDCPLYSATLIKGVKVAASPAWLKERLESIGCRSVNNVVDITNYCMYTWGQPLHAFDLDALASMDIGVRRAKPAEKLLTIDGQERTLDGEILVIADKDKAVALAGIMGAKTTEVSQETANILLEAAIFDPVVVRRGRRRLGIQSDASYRFERVVDICSTERIAAYAAGLIQKIAGASIVAAKSSSHPAASRKKIILDVDRANRILGVGDISAVLAQKSLSALGFPVKKKAKSLLQIDVPSFRPDIRLEEDLIEEIARIYGYEKIPASLAKIIPQQKSGLDKRGLVARIKQALIGVGLQEAITYSLISRELLKGIIDSDEGIEVANPLSKEQELLRPTLIPSLIRCTAVNLNQKIGYVALFEIADCFKKESGNAGVQENLSLGIVLCGERSLWSSCGRQLDRVGFAHLKGAAEAVFAGLGIDAYGFSPSGKAGRFDISACKEIVGSLFEIAPCVLDNFAIKNKELFALEMNLDKLLPQAASAKKFRPLAKFPFIQRDISMVVRAQLSLEEIYGVIIDSSQGFLQEAPAVVDFYEGKQIEDGFKGLTITCRYASEDRTLTEAEVNPVHNNVLSALTERLQVRLR